MRVQTRSHTPPSDRDFGPRSDISNDSIEKGSGGGGDAAARFEHQQRRWLAELKARNCKIVQVTYPRTANNDKELTVVRGEYLEVCAAHLHVGLVLTISPGNLFLLLFHSSLLAKFLWVSDWVIGY